MSELLQQEVVAVRRSACPGNASRHHVTGVLLKSEGELSAEDAITLLHAGGALFMIPPKGAPAYEMHMRTGLPLLLQSRECPLCKQEVLFA